MKLLERQHLLTALDECLAGAAAGVGSVVLLAGEAGIGKTSLARAFCTQHETRAQVWWGSCDALSTPRPLGPLYDIARSAAGELAALMASNASRYERFSGFLDALVSPLRPIVAVVEDVHWADEATVDLLIYIGRRIADTNAVMVVTYRDDEIGIEHPLRSVLGSLANLSTVRRLTVPRLSETAVAELAAGRVADPARIYRATGGNPFFVTEVLDAGTDGETAPATATVPETVSDAVLARVARLSAPARAVLEATAVVPDQAELDLVCAVAGTDPDTVDQCEQAGLLHGVGRSVRFRHELARLAVEHAIPPVRRPDLHARALAWLTARSGVDLARLAYHADQAGDREAVLAHAPAAAEHATRLGAHREAVAHLERALRYGSSVPQRDRAELLERYAEECSLIDRTADAVDASAAALTCWRTVDEPDHIGQCLARHSRFLWRAGRNEEAHAAARTAMVLLERRPDSPALAAAYTYAAYLRMLARDIPGAIGLGTRGIALAERYGEAALLSIALNAVGSAQWFADPDQAERTLARSLAVARECGDDAAVANAMSNLGSGAGEIRRYQTADRWLSEAITWSRQHDLDNAAHYALAWLARSHLEQGHWSEAGVTAGEVAGQSVMAPSRIVALTVLGRLRTRRGDPDPGSPLTEAWELATRTGDLQRLWPVAAARAEAAWLTGHPERIPALVDDTYRLAIRLDQQWPVGELAFWRWRAGAVAAAPVGAAEPYALQMSGDWRAAVAAWERIGCPFEAALARADSGQPDDLVVALDTFGRLGARPMANLVTARLRGLGVRRLPRRATRTTLDNPGGLTNRELEVLGLLANGRSNAEIAAWLHISPKTAGHHVSAILAKLGTHSRRDAARTARDWGITPTR